MNPLLIPPILEIGRELIDRFFPDKVAQEKERAAAELELLRLTQSERMADKAADLQLALAQIKVNEEEAKSPGTFKGGWRPAAGWACVGGLVYTFFARPLLPWFAAVVGLTVPPLPAIDTMELFALLGGLLGLGTMRSQERIKGKA